MKKDIIYLKNETYGLQVMAYDPNNLRRLNIYKGQECIIDTFDDLETFDHNLKRDFEHDATLTDRNEFQCMLFDYVKLINETTKEL